MHRERAAGLATQNSRASPRRIRISLKQRNRWWTPQTDDQALPSPRPTPPPLNETKNDRSTKSPLSYKHYLHIHTRLLFPEQPLSPLPPDPPPLLPPQSGHGRDQGFEPSAPRHRAALPSHPVPRSSRELVINPVCRGGAQKVGPDPRKQVCLPQRRLFRSRFPFPNPIAVFPLPCRASNFSPDPSRVCGKYTGRHAPPAIDAASDLATARRGRSARRLGWQACCCCRRRGFPNRSDERRIAGGAAAAAAGRGGDGRCVWVGG